MNAWCPRWSIKHKIFSLEHRFQNATGWTHLCAPPPGTVEIPINSRANKQTDEPKLFCYINRWHQGAHALHDQRWHSFVLQSAVTPIVSGECSHHRDRAPMAARLSLTQVRLEAELDRLRAECQWDKIPALVEQLHAARFHEDGEWSSPVVFLPAAHPARRSCVNWF